MEEQREINDCNDSVGVVYFDGNIGVRVKLVVL